jgi:hypothetical protein
MNIRRSIVAATAAVVLGGTAALVLPAVASAHSATSTLKFTATEHKNISWLPINSVIYHETTPTARAGPSGSTTSTSRTRTAAWYRRAWRSR